MAEPTVHLTAVRTLLGWNISVIATDSDGERFYYQHASWHTADARAVFSGDVAAAVFEVARNTTRGNSQGELEM